VSDHEIDIIEKCVTDQLQPDTVFDDQDQRSGHHAETWSFFLNFAQYQPIADILVPRFRQHFGCDIELDITHILNAYRPYGIHTDVMSGDYDPVGPRQAAWTFIIPLADYDSHTLVFQQGHETIKTVPEWVAQTCPPQHPVPDLLYDQYLTHVDRQDLRYLTVESIFPWRRGDMFAAARAKFHTSDDFPRRGIHCKRAIVIWSSVPR
jgi:hypothetical protein